MQVVLLHKLDALVIVADFVLWGDSPLRSPEEQQKRKKVKMGDKYSLPDYSGIVRTGCLDHGWVSPALQRVVVVVVVGEAAESYTWGNALLTTVSFLRTVGVSLSLFLSTGGCVCMLMGWGIQPPGEFDCRFGSAGKVGRFFERRAYCRSPAGVVQG